MSSGIFERAYSEFTEEWIKDIGGLSYDEVHCYAQSVLWEYAMNYAQKNFHGFCDYTPEISDCKIFNEHFMDFVRILFMTEDGVVEGEYLSELLEGKQLWKKMFWQEEQCGGVDELELDQCGLVHHYIKCFWKNYVIKKDSGRIIKKEEEIFWLIMAWIYVTGRIRAKLMECFRMDEFVRIDELKKIMCSRKKDKNINQVIQWIVGCYMNIFNLARAEDKKQIELISKFGSYEFLSGIFDFSEYFEYRKNHIEELLAGLLEHAFEKEVQVGLSGKKYELLLFVENWLQEKDWDAEFNGENFRTIGVKYPISKNPRAPKHEGDQEELSYYVGGAKKGIGEYFGGNYGLQKYLDEPKYLELNDKLNKETAEICRKNYDILKQFDYKRFVASFFIRIWPRKDTYMSLGSVKHMLYDIDKMVDGNKVEQAWEIMSVRFMMDNIYDKFSESIKVGNEGKDEVERKIFEAMGFGEKFNHEWNEAIKSVKYKDDEQKVQEAEDKIQMHIDCAIDLEIQNEGRDAALIYLEKKTMPWGDERAKIVIPILYDMFNLDLEKLGFGNILI